MVLGVEAIELNDGSVLPDGWQESTDSRGKYFEFLQNSSLKVRYEPNDVTTVMNGPLQVSIPRKPNSFSWAEWLRQCEECYGASSIECTNLGFIYR